MSDESIQRDFFQQLCTLKQKAQKADLTEEYAAEFEEGQKRIDANGKVLGQAYQLQFETTMAEAFGSASAFLRGNDARTLEIWDNDIVPGIVKGKGLVDELSKGILSSITQKDSPLWIEEKENEKKRFELCQAIIDCGKMMIAEPEGVAFNLTHGSWKSLVSCLGHHVFLTAKEPALIDLGQVLDRSRGQLRRI